MGAVLVEQKNKQKQEQTPKWGQCLSSKRKGKKEKTDNRSLFWGPALIEEMKNELAPKQGPALVNKKKKEKQTSPQNGGQHLLSERKK